MSKQSQLLNFYMPAEWERHRGTWLSWPHNPETWIHGTLPRIEQAWVQMVEGLSPYEEVHINILDTKHHQHVLSLLKKSQAQLEKVFFHYFPTDDSWVRDHGPIFVFDQVQKRQVILDWEYNAWGGKYPPYDQDNEIPSHIAEHFRIPKISPKMILEGGSIEVNGKGTLLTTESCLLNPNRNPQFSQVQIEGKLKEYLGVSKVLWLGDGIVGDDTDGHVDDITRFVNANTIVTAIEENTQDENYTALRENFEKVQNFRDQDGNKFEILTLPMPAPVVFEGTRLPASYANFYIANEVVLVPIFQDPNDEKALGILKECFPSRKIIGINCREVVVGLGGIHCVTQQWPSV